MSLVNGFVFSTIIETIEGFLGPLINQVLGLLNSFPVWIQGLILLGLGIFTIVGVFVFIKKFFKLFLVLAILGAIGYYLYSQGIIDNLISSLTGAIVTTVTTLL